jgi:ubiquinone/menaquinone biosynthesis C-methylase UbiE
VIRLLERDCGLQSNSEIADIGSGTGILSKIFLDHGNSVFAIEPNAEMRVAAEQALSSWAKFHSRNAAAEKTGLPDHSVDFVTAGQSFHWFEAAAALPEFRRILRSPGWIVLIWNERKLDGTPFHAAYESLLHKWSPEYQEVSSRSGQAKMLADFLRPARLHTASFLNAQQFDLPGLEGRLLSSSYAPRSGHPNHAPMLADLAKLFEQHQQDGRVQMEYDCRVYYGQAA